MVKSLCTIFTGTGSYIPERVIHNSYFLGNEFYTPEGEKITDNEETIKKFEEITGIKERRYVEDGVFTSDIAYEAAKNCLSNSDINPEELDYMVVAHNFGDVNENGRIDLVPSLSMKVKGKLGIKNTKTECYDIPFGCPGWLQGIIMVDRFFKRGFGKKALVIGAEVLSRVADPHDRDSMIYADGAGATLVQAIESEEPVGILSSVVDCGDSTTHHIMGMGTSYGPKKDGRLYFKMNGHEVFKYGVKHVPRVVKESLDKIGLKLTDILKIFIHQANEKMDYKIVQRLFRLYGVEASDEDVKNIMPMIISWLGNSSVATIPTLYDRVMKREQRGELNNHKLKPGDNIVFASIGAGGPNINSVVYRMP